MLKIDSQLLLLKLSTTTMKSTVVSYTFKRLHCTLKFKEMIVDSFLRVAHFDCYTNIENFYTESVYNEIHRNS